jgi:hypothetical protein
MNYEIKDPTFNLYLLHLLISPEPAFQILLLPTMHSSQDQVNDSQNSNDGKKDIKITEQEHGFTSWFDPYKLMK